MNISQTKYLNGKVWTGTLKHFYFIWTFVHPAKKWKKKQQNLINRNRSKRSISYLSETSLFSDQSFQQFNLICYLNIYGNFNKDNGVVIFIHHSIFFERLEHWHTTVSRLTVQYFNEQIFFKNCVHGFSRISHRQFLLHFDENLKQY